MDGVLCDFAKGVENLFGISITKWQSLSKKDRWDPIKQDGKFWEYLPWTPSGRALWGYIRKFDPHILSAYVEETFDPSCIPGKTAWIRRNLGLGSSARINLVRRSQKRLYAKANGKPAILIDDYVKNTNEFIAAGGIGITFQNHRQAITSLKRHGSF